MKKTKTGHLEINAATHAGMTGKQNEDSYKVACYFVGQKQNEPACIAVLCDGIGGHRAGEIAAEMGVSMITDRVIQGDPTDPLNTLKDAISQTNNAIFRASQSDRGREGMGTTCACAWVMGDRLYTANLGDSRIYLMRAGHLVQLTTDHTWLQEARDAGIILNEHGGKHPNAHIIRRYLGSEKEPEPDFRLWYFENESDADALGNQGFRLEQGDVILLCSDGLTDLVSDEEIKDILQNTSQSEAPHALIARANQGGGYDNVTVVLLSNPLQKKPSGRAKPKQHLVAGCLGILVLMGVLLTALVWGLRWQRKGSDQTATPTIRMMETISGEELELFPATMHSLTPTLLDRSETQAATLSPAATRTPWPTNTPSGD